MRVWDPRRREVTATVKAGRAGLWTLRFSPDGRRLAVAGGAGHVSVWRAGARLRRQATLAVNVVTSLAFTRDGRRLASGSDEGEIRVWDLEQEVDLHTLRGSEWIDALAFSRNGRLLASGGTEDLVRLWDPRVGASVGAFGWAARSRISTSARVPRRACGTRALAAARARWNSIRSLSVVGSARDGRRAILFAQCSIFSPRGGACDRSIGRSMASTNQRGVRARPRLLTRRTTRKPRPRGGAFKTEQTCSGPL